MYKLYKRPDSENWQITVTVKGYKPIRQSSGTTDKDKAEALARKIDADLWGQAKLGAKPNYTWEDAVIKWREVSEHKSSLYGDLLKLRLLTAFEGIPLADMSRVFIDEALNKLAKVRKLKNSTINRYINLIRSILNACEKDWDMLDRAPALKHRKIAPPSVRFIYRNEADRLIAAAPEKHQPVIQLALCCGLRKSNLYGLRWDQVDYQRSCAWINANQAKGKRAIPIPLNTEALAIIKAQIGKDAVRVFPFNPMINRLWKEVCKLAMIKDFTFHHLRHTWASWHVMTGTPLNVLQELGGWSKLEMVLVYAHLSAAHLQSASENVSTFSTRSNIVNFPGKDKPMETLENLERETRLELATPTLARLSHISKNAKNQ